MPKPKANGHGKSLTTVVENGYNAHKNGADGNKTNDNPCTATESPLEKLPSVSIIVPARNEEKNIERCLLSLLSQDYPNFEIIAVDDNSADSTLKIMKDMKNTNLHHKTTGLQAGKLKIVSLKDKPLNWAGKTWASQQGYLQSIGDILLLTDADTHYVKKDVVLQSVLYMQKEDLDVLTGTPSSGKLTNFWSRVTIPLWDFVNVLFGINNHHEVNNPKSKIAYLVGSFFLMKRTVFVSVGTFESVRDEIQEDKALGILVKKSGYNLKIVRLKEMVITVWADDLKTIWNGIGRTLAPLVMKNKLKVILNLLVIFFATTLPFVLLPAALLISFEDLLSAPIMAIPIHLHFYLVGLNLLPCAMMFALYSIKCKKYGITPLYSFGIVFASVFVVVACLYTTAPLLIHGKTRPIIWQGRRYTYDKEKEGFTI
ncbi:MAG TPA: glycosyltransferase [Phototrophicaceae bacterium]|nr:glycosyltransferase [Phototrophicaceae bacterium]